MHASQGWGEGENKFKSSRILRLRWKKFKIQDSPHLCPLPSGERARVRGEQIKFKS